MILFTIKEYDELSDYAYLEGSEIGEYLHQLLILWEVPESYGKSEELDNVIEKELLRWLDKFRNGTRIVETLEPQPARIRKELEWLV